MATAETDTGIAVALVADQLVNERRAANVLGISHRTLQKWRVTGGGPVFCKLGGAVRYRLVDLTNFITEIRRASTSAIRAPEVKP